MTFDFVQAVIAVEEGASLIKLLEHRNEEPALMSLKDLLNRRTLADAVEWIFANYNLFGNIVHWNKLRCLEVFFEHVPDLLLRSPACNTIAWRCIASRAARNSVPLQKTLLFCVIHGLTKVDFVDLPNGHKIVAARLTALDLFGKGDDYLRHGPTFSYIMAGAHSYRDLPPLDFLNDAQPVFRDYILTFYVAAAQLEDKLDQVHSYADHSCVERMRRSLMRHKFETDVGAKLLSIVQLNALAPCSEAVAELQSIFKSGIFCAMSHGISTQRAQCARAYWQKVWRRRYAELCFALQSLDLPAPVTLAIADATAPWLIATALAMHFKWSVVVLIKHARETDKLK